MEGYQRLYRYEKNAHAIIVKVVELEVELMAL
jgi:hypothetical protein